MCMCMSLAHEGAHRASKRELYNLLRRRTRQGLDDAPFGDGFVVGKVPLPLCFLFDQAVCAVRVRQGVRRCHLQWARRVHAEGDRGDEGGRDADADAGRGEVRASAVGTGGAAVPSATDTLAAAAACFLSYAVFARRLPF